MTPPTPPPSGPPGGPDDPQRDADRRDAEMYTKVVGYLLAGPLFYGAIGWGLDRWLGTSFLLPIGILGGVALSLYLIWFRYGSG